MVASCSEIRKEYYPDEAQARRNRRQSAENAARTRKRRGTQWRHGRKSKAELKRSRRGRSKAK
ncbi:MAG TPA: hypothetical protein VFF30_08995 [Nitrososphaerales archaeon]|nr:hypothetical protein [Nitrososphaerales archaeon]